MRIGFHFRAGGAKGRASTGLTAGAAAALGALAGCGGEGGGAAGAGWTLEGDTMIGGGGNDTLTGDPAIRTINAGGGRDVITGGDGDQNIDAGAGDDMIAGGAGDDVVDGGSGTDTMVYPGPMDGYTMMREMVFRDGRAVELFVVRDDERALAGDEGTDRLENVEVLRFEGAEPVDVADFGAALVSMAGDGADNVINGEAGAQTITGGAGHDTISGGGGDDTVDGGAGDDTAVFGGPRGDYAFGWIVEGSGVAGYTVSHLDDGPDGTDSLFDVEFVRFGDETTAVAELTPNLLVGSAMDDTLNGGGGDQTITGGGGDDAIDGGDGEDTAVFGGARGDYAFGWIVEGGAVTGHIVRHLDDGTDGTDSLFNVESVRFGDGTVAVGELAPAILVGSAMGDTLNGDGGDQAITGGGGNDTITGGGGNDAIDGGGGEDTAVYRGARSGHAIERDLVIENGVRIAWVTVTDTAGTGGDGGDDGADTLVGVENLLFLTEGGGRTDGEELAVADFDFSSLTGDDAANVLDGGTGNQTIAGGGGNDTIHGGDGDDTAVYRGARSDYAIEREFVIENGLRFIRVTVTDIAGTGGAGGDEGADTLEGVETLLFLAGGGGGTDREELAVADIEFSTLTGDDGANVLNGGEGSQTIIGGGGDDTIAGGAGADSIFGGDGEDVIDGGAGADTISGGAGEDRVAGGAGADALFGGAADDVIDGGAGEDTAVYMGSLRDFAFRFKSPDGVFEVVDMRRDDGLDEGRDALRNVENLRFGSMDATVRFGFEIPAPVKGDVGTDIFAVFGPSTLTGGGGADVYQFEDYTDSALEEKITITDFSPDDRIAMADYHELRNLQATLVALDDGTLVTRLGGPHPLDEFELDLIGDHRAYVLDRIYYIGNAPVVETDAFVNLRGNLALTIGAAGEDLPDFSDWFEGGSGGGLTFSATVSGGSFASATDIGDAGLGLTLTGDGALGGAFTGMEEFTLRITAADARTGERIRRDVVVTPLTGALSDPGGDGDNPDLNDSSSSGRKIFGLGGDDAVAGGVGNDVLYGGSGTSGLAIGTDDDTAVYADDIGGYDITAFWETGVNGTAMDAVRFILRDNRGAGADDEGRDTAVGFEKFRFNGVDHAVITAGDDGTDDADIAIGTGGGDADIDAGGGDDLIFGFAGGDAIGGGAGDDKIFGGAGDDVIRGGAGADTIEGGLGDDRIFGDSTATADDAGATDTAVYLGQREGFAFRAARGDFDDFTDIVELTVRDVATTGSGNDALDEGQRDRLYGVDAIRFGSGSSGKTLTVGGRSTANADDNIVFGTSGAEGGEAALDGFGGDDVIFGFAGDDVIFGGAGGDTIFGGAGNDFLYGHVLNDHSRGGDADTAAYEGTSGGFSVTAVMGGPADGALHGVVLFLVRDIDPLGPGGDEGVDILVGFERFEFDGVARSIVGHDVGGVYGPDIIVGDNDANGTMAAPIRGDAVGDLIFGLGGDDFLEGGLGDDVIMGGAGNDTIGGGAGDDTAVFLGARGDYDITAVSGNSVISYEVAHARNIDVFDEGTDTLVGIEILRFVGDPLDDDPDEIDLDGNFTPDDVRNEAARAPAKKETVAFVVDGCGADAAGDASREAAPSVADFAVEEDDAWDFHGVTMDGPLPAVAWPDLPDWPDAPEGVVSPLSGHGDFCPCGLTF